MRLSTSALTCLALAGAAFAAPSTDTSHLTFTSKPPPTHSISSWLTRSIQTLFSPLLGAAAEYNGNSAFLATQHDSDKSIYDVIISYPHFSKLAKAVNYSSDSTKDLLKGKTGVPLTFFAPVDRDDDHHHVAGALASINGPHSAALMQSLNSWSIVSKHIADYENIVSAFDHPEGDKEKRKRRLAYFIDGVLAYHLIDADQETVSFTQLAQNSTVGTKLTIDGKVAKYIGKLNDGLPLRIRIGKSLLPRPGVYLNFYSRVVYPDVKLANGVLHAVEYPLFQFPSILQGLFWSQPQFSTLTSALLKTGSDGYLALPTPKHPQHKYHHKYSHGHGHGLSDPKGTLASTLFAPSNAAWDRLPWAFRAFLFSPGKGEELLGKILMLHAIPNDIIYADSVHHVNEHGKPSEVRGATYTLDSASLAANFWSDNGDGDDEGDKPPLSGWYNVTRYVFDSVLPKIHSAKNRTTSSNYETSEFEKVHVDVYRYHLLPGSKGPLQTRMSVQGVAVSIQDVVNLNGAQHLITRFIKPKGHPHKGVWAEVAEETRKAGFGHVDLVQETKVGKW